MLLQNEYWDEALNRLALRIKGSEKQEIYENLYSISAFERETIVDELCNNKYQWSIPEKILIAKSGTKKKRIVYVYNYKDRLIQGVLYRVLSDYFADKISDLCFSYKKKCSTSSAIKYIKENRLKEYKYGVKVDIHAYFNSVSEERVHQMIDELFVNEELKYTMESLYYDNRVLYKGKIINEYKALIPGSSLASFFANYCLNELDVYFSGISEIYARYSDDIIVLSSSEERLHECLGIILSYLNKYNLTMNPDKYTWFLPGDNVDYLGLKIDDKEQIDLSTHAKQKIKKQIHRWCRKGRQRMELEHASFEKEAKAVFRQLNNKNFKCYVRNEATFGWCHYAFRYITTTDTLFELDCYLKDSMRAMYTGKHNKANFRYFQNGELEKLGMISLVDLYKIYKKDFDYYLEIIELL